ncbi:MAG: hypothetical protein E6G51_06560 [Actinobacteria bacterium]|nr:MAG: hypothetical protein E6G51_06560 [Actinomycetota bacterium]
MGPFDAWRRQELQISSERSRCEDANRRALATRPAKPLEPLPPFSPSGSMMLTPAAALKRLMTVSLPALGHGYMAFVARWSWVPYLWAFASPASGKPLRLSTPAAQLAGRRKALLSEQLGIAIGLSVMERHLKLGARDAFVVPIDADVAIAAAKAGRFAFGQRSKRGSRPDYFVIKWVPGEPVEVHSLECKGKSTPPGAPELASAARQLHGVGVGWAGGFQPPPGVVVASSMNERVILAEAFDPEGDEIWVGPPAEPDREAVPSVQKSGEEDLVIDLPRFRRLLIDIHEATLLEIGGGPGDGGAEEVRFFETPLGAFRGAAYTVPLSPGLEAEAFLGVERGIYEALAGSRLDSAAEARAVWAATFRERSSAGQRDPAAQQDALPEWDLVEVDEERMTSYTLDENGVMLHLQIRPRSSRSWVSRSSSRR